MRRRRNARETGRNIDDPAIVAEMISDSLNKEEWRLEVDRHQLVERGFRCFFQRRRRGNARIVDENIERWRAGESDRGFLKLLPQAVGRCFPCPQIGIERDRLRTEGLDLADRCLCGIGICAVMDADKTCTFFRKRQGGGAANTA
ncbi:hypothetical protein D3C78_1313820 [compost metagenome]